MSDQNTNPPAFQLLRGSKSQNDRYTGPEGSLTYDRTQQKLRLHDGATEGGHDVGLQDVASQEVHHVRINEHWIPINEVLVDYGTLDNWVTIPKYLPGQEVEGGIYVGTYECNEKLYHLIVSKEAVAEEPVNWSDYELVTNATSTCDVESNNQKIFDGRWKFEDFNEVVGDNITAMALFRNEDSRWQVREDWHADRIDGWMSVTYSDKPPAVFDTRDWSLVYVFDDIPPGATCTAASHSDKSVIFGFAEPPYVMIAVIDVPLESEGVSDHIRYLPDEGHQPGGPIFDVDGDYYNGGNYYTAEHDGVYEYHHDGGDAVVRRQPFSYTAEYLEGKGPFTRGRIHLPHTTYSTVAIVLDDEDLTVEHWWNWEHAPLAVDGDLIASTSCGSYDSPDWRASVHTGGKRYSVWRIDRGYNYPIEGYPALGDYTPKDAIASPDGQYLFIATEEAPYLFAVDVDSKTVIPVKVTSPIYRLADRAWQSDIFAIHENGEVTRIDTQRLAGVVRTLDLADIGYDIEAYETLDFWDTGTLHSDNYWFDFTQNKYFDAKTLEYVGDLDDLAEGFDWWRFVDVNNTFQYLPYGQLVDGRLYYMDVNTLEIKQAHPDVTATGSLWKAYDGNTYVLNANTARNVETGEELALDFPLSRNAVQIMSDSLLFVSRGRDLDCFVWDVPNKEIVKVFEHTKYRRRTQRQYVEDVSRDGRWAALVGSTNSDALNEFGDQRGHLRQLVIWDNVTREIHAEVPLWSWISKAHFTRDSKYLVLCNEYDIGSPIVDVEKGSVIGRLPGAGFAIGFNADNELIYGNSVLSFWNNSASIVSLRRMLFDNPAKEAVVNYTVGDNNDWLLPSTVQTDLIKQVLPDHMGGPVWTSQEVDATTANDDEGLGSKTEDKRHVYAVRVFEDTDGE